MLLTHPHADHIHGIDDLRPLYLKAGARIDIHMDEPTALRVREVFSYVFETPEGAPIRRWRPICGFGRQPVPHRGRGGPIEATPFDLDHGEINALGFRIGDLAYTPDVKRIPEASRPLLEGLDVWIVDALRYRPHPSHFSLDEALAGIEAMRPKRAILTNLHTDLDYEILRARLPGARRRRPMTGCGSRGSNALKGTASMPPESAIRDFLRAHEEAETRFLAEIVKVPSDNPPGDCDRSAERWRSSSKDSASRSSATRSPRTSSRPTA